MTPLSLIPEVEEAAVPEEEAAVPEEVPPAEEEAPAVRPHPDPGWLRWLRRRLRAELSSSVQSCYLLSLD